MRNSIIRKGKQKEQPDYEQKNDIFGLGNIGPEVPARYPGGNVHQTSENNCLKI